MSDYDAAFEVAIEDTKPSSLYNHSRPRSRPRRSDIGRPFDYQSRSMLGLVEQRPTAALSFSEAVNAMRAGKAIKRACGRRLFVYMAHQGERFCDALGCTVFLGPEDVFATDWEIAGEAIGWHR
jgi:hypothetical protein